MDLRALLDHYRGPLTGLIRSWGASWADAEELAQEAFAEAWLRREACRGDWREPAVFGAWLRGVAKNVWRSRARTDRRREARVRADDTQVDGAAAAEAPEPSAEVLALRGAIDRLPRRHREVVLMHHLEGSPVADVAALLGATPKAVEGRLYQARKKLRAMLAPGGTRLLGTGVWL